MTSRASAGSAQTRRRSPGELGGCANAAIRSSRHAYKRQHGWRRCRHCRRLTLQLTRPPPSCPVTQRRPTAGGGSGSLTVVDNRTGKRYEIAISEHGTIKATDLKQIKAGGDGVGLRTFDNGCGRTASCMRRGARDCFLGAFWRPARQQGRLEGACAHCSSCCASHPSACTRHTIIAVPSCAESLQVCQHHRLQERNLLHRRRCGCPAVPWLPH